MKIKVWWYSILLSLIRSAIAFQDTFNIILKVWKHFDYQLVFWNMKYGILELESDVSNY